MTKLSHTKARPHMCDYHDCKKIGDHVVLSIFTTTEPHKVARQTRFCSTAHARFWLKVWEHQLKHGMPMPLPEPAPQAEPSVTGQEVITKS